MVNLSQTMWRTLFVTNVTKSFLACGVASHVQRKSSAGLILGACLFIIHVSATDVIQLLGGFADSKYSDLYKNASIIKLWTVKEIYRQEADEVERTERARYR